MTYHRVLDGFEPWYAALHPLVVGAVWAACGDPDVAADAADEAFLRAYIHREKLGSMGSPEAWVCRVAINVMRRRMRRRILERKLLGRHESGQVSVVPSDHSEVWSAVRSLPPRQRTAVVLRYVVDLPEAGVAQAMGVTRGSVAATLSLARGRLAGVLEQEVSEVLDGEGISRG